MLVNASASLTWPASVEPWTSLGQTLQCQRVNERQPTCSGLRPSATNRHGTQVLQGLSGLTSLANLCAGANKRERIDVPVLSTCALDHCFCIALVVQLGPMNCSLVRDTGVQWGGKGQ